MKHTANTKHSAHREHNVVIFRLSKTSELTFLTLELMLLCLRSDKEKIAKIVSSLGLRLPSVVTDAKAHLKSLLSQWLPLSQAVLG